MVAKWEDLLGLPEPIRRAQSILLKSFPSALRAGHVAGVVGVDLRWDLSSDDDTPQNIRP
ncbi:MAG: hypothetical protein ABSE80_10815 [Halobacteriota archaeon]